MDKPKRSFEWILQAPTETNLAELLEPEELSAIAQEVLRNYDIDVQNRRDWDQQAERALKLAKQVLERKSTPWAGASNVKHPLITVATIQFAARAYPEICKTGKVVKCQITGEDKPEPGSEDKMKALPQAPAPGAAPPPAASAQPSPLPPPGPGSGMPQPGSPMVPGVPGPGGEPGQPPKQGPKQLRSDRIQSHMNWQLTQEMTDWEADMDTLLHVLPVLGVCYKKSYYSKELRHNVSELVLPSDCMVSKSPSRDIKKARRITHRLWIFRNDAIERMNSGSWLTVDLGVPPSADSDTDAPHEFLEQHCYFDLDGDGYKEPYIVTVHKHTLKVVRISARFVTEGVEPTVDGKVKRIVPDHYFTAYHFIPNPDGSMNSLGFGHLLEPINSAANTALNQLLDAGHLANAGGGFIGRNVRMRGGTFTFSPGRWEFVDTPGANLRESLVPNPSKEPSTVLFQLLQFLVNSGKEISSVQDVLTGDANFAANMPVGTMMALVEQGLKVYVAIYKRIHRSLTEELKKLYILNARFLDPRISFQVAGYPEEFVERSDYKADDTMVMPVADPELSSDMQRLLKAQALKEVTGRPGLDEVEISRRMVRAIRPENVDALLLSDEQISGRAPVKWKPPPPPQQILAQAKAQRMQQQAQEANVRLQMDVVKFQLELEELRDKIANVKADTMLKLAKAADTGRGDLIEVYKFKMEQLAKEAELKAKMIQGAADNFTKLLQKSVDPAQQMGLEPGPGGPAPAGGLPAPRQGGGPVEAGRPI